MNRVFGMEGRRWAVQERDPRSQPIIDVCSWGWGPLFSQLEVNKKKGQARSSVTKQKPDFIKGSRR